MATLESAITGAVASALANMAVYPLDLTKTLIQTQLQDDTSNTDHKTNQKKTKSDNDSTEQIHDDDESSQTSTNASNNLHNRKFDHVLDCMIHVVKHRGISGLYQGMSTSVAGTFIMNFCYFFWYTFFRKRYINIKLLKNESSKLKITTLEELSIGIVAAAMSQVFTSPIAAITTRQQTIHDKEQAKLVNVVKNLWKESNGDITAFWKGLKVGLVLTLNPSITYASYQRLKKILYHSSELSGTETLSVFQNFILGVISKSISTLITQPLIIAKASLQKNGSKFKTFQQVLIFLFKNEGIKGLWKGILPQLTKGVIVQGLLFAFRGELIKNLNKLFSIILRHKIKK